MKAPCKSPAAKMKKDKMPMDKSRGKMDKMGKDEMKKAKKRM